MQRLDSILTTIYLSTIKYDIINVIIGLLKINKLYRLYWQFILIGLIEACL